MSSAAVECIDYRHRVCRIDIHMHIAAYVYFSPPGVWSAKQQLPAGAGDEQKGLALLRKERSERRKRKRVNLLQKEGGEEQPEGEANPSGEAQVGRPFLSCFFFPLFLSFGPH